VFAEEHQQDIVCRARRTGRVDLAPLAVGLDVTLEIALDGLAVLAATDFDEVPDEADTLHGRLGAFDQGCPRPIRPGAAGRWR
jgi:hypothetical protein